MASDGLSAERLAEITEQFRRNEFDHIPASRAGCDLLAELARVTAELQGVDAALGNRSAFDECKTRMEKINKMCATAARAKVAESALDRVWSALGITTVPVGMDVGEKVRELAELNAVNAAGVDRAMAVAEGASATVAALTEQLRVATDTAWLIETGDHRYWDGRKASRDGFVHDPNDAVRFSRFEDTERIINWLMQEYRVFLCSRQHVWLPLPATRPE